VTVTLVFLAAVGGIIAWWLMHQRLGAKPWLEAGPVDAFPATEASSLPAAKIGLGVFLAVVGALFAMLSSAYVMRMHMGDWQHVPTPKLLWLNTGVLVLGSVGLEWARMGARQRSASDMRTGLLAGGAATLVFVAGQLEVWRQLVEAGCFDAPSPADAFFFMLTGLHGLHLLGGVVALGRTGLRMWRGGGGEALRLSVELCAVYWHFLLVLWLLLFALLLLT
jgi:cytochrome c oxidase subunit 3